MSPHDSRFCGGSDAQEQNARSLWEVGIVKKKHAM